MKKSIRRAHMVGSALLLCMLAGCKGKAPTPPVAYTLGEDSAPSVDHLMEENSGALASIEEPTEDGSQSYLYRYDGVSGAAELVTLYLDEMTGKEQGFVLAEEEHQVLSERPALEDELGLITLERNSAQEGEVFRIVLAWAQSAFTVEVSKTEGEVAAPVEQTAEPQREDSLYTMIEQLDYLYSLPPERLGLAGSSMREYHIYAQDGAVIVDGIPCKQFNVYLVRPPENTNVIQGCYFLSADRKLLYQMDPVAGATVSLK